MDNNIVYTIAFILRSVDNRIAPSLISRTLDINDRVELLLEILLGYACGFKIEVISDEQYMRLNEMRQGVIRTHGYRIAQ